MNRMPSALPSPARIYSYTHTHTHNPNTNHTAAGLISSSNPEGSNWRVFQAAAAPGSWALLLRRAGHTTFMKPPTGVETWLLDRVFGGGAGCVALCVFGKRPRLSPCVYACLHKCMHTRGQVDALCAATGLCLLGALTVMCVRACAGKMSRDEAISETAAAMLAWFQHQLPAAAGAPSMPPAGGAAAAAVVTAAASATQVPLTAAGLNAAAIASAAAVDENGGGGGGDAAAAAAFSARVQASFKEWLATPLVAEQVEFTVKGSSGGGGGGGGGAGGQLP